MEPTIPDISVLTQDDLPGILELVRERYQPPYSTDEFWRWRYFGNPVWDVRVYGIRDECGRVLAIQPVSLVPFIYKGNKSHAGLLTAAITGRVHQRKGFFRALVKSIVHDLESEGVQFIYTFPNPLSRRGFENFPGWMRYTSFSVTGRLLLPFAPGRRANGTEIFDLSSEFNKVDDTLRMLPYSNGQRDGMAHSGQYVKWRYAANPVNRYWIACYKNGEESGYAVFRKMLIKNIPIGAIVEFNSNSETASLTMIRAMLSKLARSGCIMALRLVSPCDPYSKQFSKLSFRQMPGLIVRRDFPVFAHLLSAEELPADWHITWGDMDTI